MGPSFVSLRFSALIIWLLVGKNVLHGINICCIENLDHGARLQEVLSLRSLWSPGRDGNYCCPGMFSKPPSVSTKTVPRSQTSVAHPASG